MSLVLGTRIFAYANKGRRLAAQLQRLFFRYIDSTISLISKSHAIFSGCTEDLDVCVGLGQKPRRPVFSERGSIIIYTNFHQITCS